MSNKYDIAIIGAGAGGLSLAAGAAQLGLKVALIEKGQMGGDCLNYGCIPSKSLLAVAKQAWQAKQAAFRGLHFDNLRLDFTEVMAHVNQVIATIAVHDSETRFEALGVKVIKEHGQFIDPHTLKAGDSSIHARYFVVATGSSPAIPAIPGLAAVNYLTNETVFSLTELPAHLMVVGGGPIGCELAQAFALLGARVTLLEGAEILNQDDREAAALVRSALGEAGVKLYEHVQIRHIEEPRAHQVVIHAEIEGESLLLTGSHCLIATGRQANVHDLGCEQAGIQLTPRGIAVDKHLRSSNKKIYALGDALGSRQFTHMANAQAGLILKKLAFKLSSDAEKLMLPWVTYTTPELAQVGYTEQQCQSQGLSYEVYKLDYQANDRALAEGENQGFIKLLTSPKGKILGVTLVGAEAGELILPWIMLIREGKSLRSFTDVIIPYPTLNELSKRVAGLYYAPRLFSNKVKKLVRFLQWF